MELFNLPIELIYTNILPFLKWNDLLKARRVCKKFRKHVDSFLLHEFGGIPERIEIEINEKSRPWSNIVPFLQWGLPASNFYLINPSGHAFFEDKLASKFLKYYHRQITRLRVLKMSTSPTGPERAFYEHLKNLSSLQIECVVGRSESHGPQFKATCWKGLSNPFNRRRLHYTRIGLPKSFENLKILKINQGHHLHHSKKRVSGIGMMALNLYFLDRCKNLEEVALGVTCNSGSFTSQLLIFHFQELIIYLEGRARNFPRDPNLAIFDFKNYSYINRDVTREISPSFLELCQAFSRHSVRVRNVPANLFKAFHPLRHSDLIISSVVESLEGLHPSILTVDLPHLTSLSIVTLTQTSFQGGQLPYRTAWPCLQDLSLFVNTRNLWPCTRQGQKIPGMPVSALFQLLFGSRASRTSMKALRLIFSSRMMDTLSSDPAQIPCPSISSIVASCPNVTKLEIINWPEGDNMAFSRLWRGLKGLEEVRLTKCKLLGDQGFIGEDEKRPLFLQLKNLKKLWLVDLDKMPMITDKTFTHVLSHVKLVEFIVYSDKPLKNITREGVSSLLSGEFAASIEKFPFGSWSLSNVNCEEWKALQNQFH